MKNFYIIVLDGLGVGELPDAKNYNDQGSNTLGNLALKLGGLDLPNMNKFGFGNIIDVKGMPPVEKPLASYGKMNEVSPGKDSTTGHWELSGITVDFDFPYYPNGFPDQLMNKFLLATGLKGYLGNKAASGTEIIKELGGQHVKTGYPIIYTSADSVFQIAAHEDVIPLEKQYEICSIARHQILTGPDSVGRVIARPFIGTTGNYKRTTNRKDYSINPTSKTILNLCQDQGIKTIAIGKINDLFNYYGIDVNVKTKSNSEGVEKIIEYSSRLENSLIFTNLVDFDVYYGHRNDPEGYYSALKEFDIALPNILECLDDTDTLIITSDHGNDPTMVSTDHSREYVPVLLFQKNKDGLNLGTRDTFADVAQTVAHFYSINNVLNGKSLFLD